MAKNVLAPGLLLAAPRLDDPNFERTVVLLAKHEEEGSLGWVINGRSLGSVRKLLRDAKLIPTGVTLPTSSAFDLDARIGGPVATSTAWMMYRRVDGLMVPGEIEIGDDLAVCGDSTAFAAVLRGLHPQDFRLVLGYAGWGAGQLEGEIREGAWLPASVDASLILDTAADDQWNAAYHGAIGAAPAAFTSMRRGQA